MKACFAVAVALFVVSLNGVTAAEPVVKSHKLTSVSMRKMADSLHAVIAADQQVYAELTAQRMAASAKGPVANELPSHATMLRTASEGIQRGGAEFSYTLRSLWPIDGRNGPQTESEQAGLKAVVETSENFYVEETLGGRSYFTAIYANRATLASCVACHNRDVRSPRRNFKINDVMGALVVRIPLEF